MSEEQAAIDDYRRHSINSAVVDHFNSLFTDLAANAIVHGWSMEQVRDQLSLSAGDDVADAWVEWSEEGEDR